DFDGLEPHAARLWHREAGEHVHQRRLAGAVGADDRDELARAHAQADAIERARLAVELPHVHRLEQRHDAGARRGSTRPMSPRGKKTTTTARIAPKTKRQ